MGVTPSWGPFNGPADAAKRLGGFVDVHLGPEVGIAWSSLDGVTPLRRPSFNGRSGTCLVVQWTQAPPAPPKPHGLWQNVKALADAASKAWVQGEMAQMQAQQMESQALSRGISSGAHAVGRLFNRAVASGHRADAVGVLVDALAVGVTIAVGLTGVGLLAEVAFYGGLALLAMDGTDYGMEVAGYDHLADETKRVTEPFRIVAVIATLPDAAWGGYKVIREMPGIRMLRASSLSTAARADADAARVASTVTREADSARAARAQKYAAIGERANARAAAYAAKLRNQWALEVSPRATLTPASIYLLVDDEMHTKDPGIVSAFLRQYVFHVTAVGRG